MQNKAMGMFVFTGLMAFVCPLVQAATYYASPDEGPESTKDCLTSETAGFLVTAAKLAKAADARDPANPATVMMQKGDYDFSGIVRDVTSSVTNLIDFSNNGQNVQYVRLVGATGKPEDVRVIGPGIAQNVRFAHTMGQNMWSTKGVSLWLDGISFTNFGIRADGGVLQAQNGSATPCGATNCVFTGCMASSGGALYFMSRGTVTDCTFRDDNFTAKVSTAGTGTGGGGVYNAVCTDSYFEHCCDTNFPAKNQSGGGAVAASPCMNCVFSGCKAYSGAAAYSGNNTAGSERMSGCLITNCYATSSADTSDSIVKNYNIYDCAFVGCSGAGIYGLMIGANAVSGCVFTKNRCGSISMYNPLKNCLVVSNDIALVGNNSIGMVGTCFNCTIVSNKADYLKYGAGIVGEASVYNCLFVGNTSRHGSSKVKFYSCVSDKALDSGVTVKPNTVVDAKAGRCLKWGTEAKFGISDMPVGITLSPLLYNAGTNLTAEAATIWTADDVDYAGNGRLNGPVDIGCYERWPKIGLQILVR